jgi:hypothetical protein
MVSLRHVTGAAAAGCLLALSAVTAWAQAPDFSGTMTRLAEDLARGVARPGGRVAVVSIDDPTGVYGPSVPVTLTGQLHSALASQHEPSRTIELVTATDVTRAINELRLPRPIDAAGAALVGALVNASYVTVGELTPLGAGRARIALQLVDVGTRRIVRSSLADVALASAGPVSSPAGPSAAVVAPLAPPNRPFWNARRAAIASGFAASAAAAFMAMSAERDLRDTRNQLLQVPPGATAEWNALLDEATGQERTRNFWWGAVAGVSGVTLAYMLASESPDRAPRPFPAGALSLPGRWRLHVNPVLPFVGLRRSF